VIRIRERLERSKINTRGFRFLGLEGGPCSPSDLRCSASRYINTASVIHLGSHIIYRYSNTKYESIARNYYLFHYSPVSIHSKR
jgi:hypothetical protein